jgi:hypothetical protein
MPDLPNSIPGPIRRGDGRQGDVAAARDLEVAHEVAVLRQRLDRLEMITEALWSVLKSHTDASEAEAIRLIEEIDMRDGKLNGRTVSVPQDCAQCSRVVSSLTGICPYCGAQNFRTSVF